MFMILTFWYLHAGKSEKGQKKTAQNTERGATEVPSLHSRNGRGETGGRAYGET
jgi:hypothetical protein